MGLNYTYVEFEHARNPLQPLAAVEYVLMRKDLNNFMNDMLRKLYKDKEILGQESHMNGNRILLFAMAFAASVTGFILFDHPGWIVCSAILGGIMLMAVLAVPITHLQDQVKEKRVRTEKINSIKSYYLFHYSLIRNSGTYNEYLDQIPQADLSKFQFYLQKYS